MAFTTLTFALFLSPLLVLFLCAWPKALLGLLTLASYLFYAWAQPAYALLLLGITVATDFLGKQIAARESQHTRKLMISVGVAANLALLGVFKYGGFAIDNLARLLRDLGIHSQPAPLSIALPLGSSFITFRSISYLVDVFRRKIAPCRSFPLFALHLAYFPQIASGPIERADQLIPQLENIPSLREKILERLPEAVSLFALGWARKHFADLLAPVSAALFDNPAGGSAAFAAFGVLAYGLQIYGDFAGYTNMAQGVSWLFGVRLVENFNLPYLAKDMDDFWRRWHISLSTWIREYLHLPLSRKLLMWSQRRFLVALQAVSYLVTMSLIGLWHGASWNFVLWGTLHGSYLAVQHLYFKLGFPRLPKFPAWLLTQLCVFLAWIPFRAESSVAASAVLKGLVRPGWTLPPLQFVYALAGLMILDRLSHVRISGKSWFATRLPEHWRAGAWIAACIWLFLVEYTIWGQQSAQFIYFQF